MMRFWDCVMDERLSEAAELYEFAAEAVGAMNKRSLVERAFLTEMRLRPPARSIAGAG